MNRDDLLHQMDEQRAGHNHILTQVSPVAVVYADSGWRVQDLVAHITHWEEQALLTLQHTLRGERYFLPNFRELGIDGFNALDYERHRDDATDQIIEQFAAIRTQFKAFLADLSDDQWELPVRWFGTEQTPLAMIQRILWHEDYHMAEITMLIPQA